MNSDQIADILGQLAHTTRKIWGDGPADGEELTRRKEALGERYEKAFYLIYGGMLGDREGATELYQYLIDDELVVLLQCIREHFGAKVHITSGYRTAAYNATLPGASSNSQHIQGRAADFWVEGVTVNAVADYAEKLLPGRGGIGRYPKDAAHPKRVTGWVHIDTRPNKSRWKM